MREIKFRAKRVDNGEWVEGYLYRISEYNHPFIMLKNKFGKAFEVDENTVCQYTGLKDKNGKEIWENDIVKYHFGEDMAAIKFGKYQNCFDSQKACHCGFYVDWQGCYLRKDLGYWIEMLDDSNIIGNIFDNPELLNNADKQAGEYADNEVLKSAT